MAQGLNCQIVSNWHWRNPPRLVQVQVIYLNDRKQCVVIDGVKSSLIETKAGVPQGSRLGPLLFIIFINDIVQDIESEILIFADDTTLLASGLDIEI